MTKISWLGGLIFESPESKDQDIDHDLKARVFAQSHQIHDLALSMENHGNIFLGSRGNFDGGLYP